MAGLGLRGLVLRRVFRRALLLIVLVCLMQALAHSAMGLVAAHSVLTVIERTGLDETVFNRLAHLGSTVLWPGQHTSISLTAENGYDKLYVVIEPSSACRFTIESTGSEWMESNDVETARPITLVYSVYCGASCNTSIRLMWCRETETPTMLVSVYAASASDTNLDGRVDEHDVAGILAAYGARLGDASYSLLLDANSDGVVDYADVALVACRLRSQNTNHGGGVEAERAALRLPGGSPSERLVVGLQPGATRVVELLVDEQAWGIEVRVDGGLPGFASIRPGRGWAAAMIGDETIVLYRVGGTVDPVGLTIMLGGDSVPDHHALTLAVEQAGCNGVRALNESAELVLEVYRASGTTVTSHPTANSMSGAGLVHSYLLPVPLVIAVLAGIAVRRLTPRPLAAR